MHQPYSHRLTQTYRDPAARSDNTGPRQRFAIAIIEVCSRMASPGNVLTLRWVLSHSDIGGNEVADAWAKDAAESPLDAVPGDYLRETSFAHMTRMATMLGPRGWQSG